MKINKDTMELALIQILSNSVWGLQEIGSISFKGQCRISELLKKELQNIKKGGRKW